MSCIDSSGERFIIFRNLSFTLFTNESDLRERSDSAAVSESISISVTNLLDTGFTVLVFDISPDFRTWEDHLSSLFHSEEFDELASVSLFTGFPVPVCCTFDELRGYFLTFRFGVHRVFGCSRGKYGRIPYTASRYQIRHRSWFCCDSFFTCTLLCSFRHRSESVGGAEMANVE